MNAFEVLERADKPFKATEFMITCDMIGWWPPQWDRAKDGSSPYAGRVLQKLVGKVVTPSGGKLLAYRDHHTKNFVYRIRT